MKELKNSGTQELKSSGFTLLELLVVIGIIALLVSIAAVSYSAAQVRTRDARRRADLNSMKDALEQYYSATSFVYPATCSDAATDFLKSSWPVDPINDGNYNYTTSATCAADNYCICAQLEVAGSGNSNVDCGWVSGGDYYCVGNLQ